MLDEPEFNALRAALDAENAIDAAAFAGVPCIALLSGGIGRDELTEAGAAEIYPGPADLLAALRDSLLGTSGR